MTTLTRVFAKLFGSDAPLEEIGIFGSAKAGNFQTSKNIATIQSLPAYTEGWGSAVVSSDNFPPMEEVTGVLNTLSYQICYLLQEGISVYNSETEYSNTSIVKVVNGNQVDFYLSQADGNQGNSLSNTTYWRKADIVGTREVGVPQITLNPNLTLPDNCIWLEGQEDDLTNPDFPNLKNIYGTAYNTTETHTGKYSLPDFRNKYICGLNIVNGSTSTQMGYVDAGLPSITCSTAPNHTHGVGSYYIYGVANRIGRTSASGTSRGGCLFDSTDKVSSSGFNSSTDSYAHSIQIRAGVDGTWHNSEQYYGFYGSSGASGSHSHTITTSVPTNLNTVKVDGIKVRVYTRYE